MIPSSINFRDKTKGSGKNKFYSSMDNRCKNITSKRKTQLSPRIITSHNSSPKRELNFNRVKAEHLKQLHLKSDEVTPKI